MSDSRYYKFDIRTFKKYCNSEGFNPQSSCLGWVWKRIFDASYWNTCLKRSVFRTSALENAIITLLPTFDGKSFLQHRDVFGLHRSDRVFILIILEISFYTNIYLWGIYGIPADLNVRERPCAGHCRSCAPHISFHGLWKHALYLRPIHLTTWIQHFPLPKLYINVQYFILLLLLLLSIIKIQIIFYEKLCVWGDSCSSITRTRLQLKRLDISTHTHTCTYIPITYSHFILIYIYN